MNTTTRLLFSLTFALIFASGLRASEDATPIDWDRAKSLHQKSKAGQSLSDEEKAYLEKAVKARRAGNPNRNTSSDPTRGDGSGERPTVKPVLVSEVDSPVKMLTATASDGNTLEVAYRVPKADRPLPAMVFIHGSLGQSKPRELMHSARANPTHTRFLSKGYVAVAATFRTYAQEPLSRGPILDAIAIVRAVKELPEVDAESVVVFGTSGGGSIGLELAGEEEADPLAVVIGEPATVLYTGLMTDLSMRDKSMKDYPTLYTDERRKATEAKIARIACPLLIHHGDTHPLKKINFDIVFPAIEKAGKTMVIKHYPGEDHGFYWGNRTSEKVLDSVVSSTLEFIEPLLKSQPAE